MARKKILWLCSWYPGRLDPFNGDFIQRHARAAALYNDIHVLHLAPDETSHSTTAEPILHHAGGLTEQVIYYKPGSSGWSRIQAHYRWLKLYRDALRDIVIRQGRPDLVHVQVPMKAGIMALWFRKRYRVPYLVTEHWGIYNEVAQDNFRVRRIGFRYFTRKIFTRSLAFISVSRFLAEGVNKMVVKKKYEVIPNATDTSLFYYVPSITSVFRFIHVSNMVPLKNTEGILRAFANLYEQYKQVELVMVGDRDASMRTVVASLGLSEGIVRFKGEIPYEQVAKEMQQSHCLILFSNIENSPCVIGEALCCGLPVIATKVGGIPELVEDSNSHLVDTGDEAGLANAMLRMIKERDRFNRAAIAAKAAERFSYETVGAAFDAIYRRVLNSSS